jgi:hypothetical protein
MRFTNCFLSLISLIVLVACGGGSDANPGDVYQQASNEMKLTDILLQEKISGLDPEIQAYSLSIAKGKVYKLWAAGSNNSGSSSNILMCGKCDTLNKCTNDIGNPVGFAQNFKLTLSGNLSTAFVPAACSSLPVDALSLNLTNVASGSTVVMTMTVENGPTVVKTLNVQ